MAKKKTWKEKLHDNKYLPKIEKFEGKLLEKHGEGSLLIPAPVEVDQIMKYVPLGKLTIINRIREKLAEKHNATMTCPICTGIFAKISAEAANEEFLEGKEKITPFWRTLKEGGVINEKYPGNVELQISKLEKEGFSVAPKGKKDFKVIDYEKFLV